MAAEEKREETKFPLAITIKLLNHLWRLFSPARRSFNLGHHSSPRASGLLKPTQIGRTTVLNRFDRLHILNAEKILVTGPKIADELRAAGAFPLTTHAIIVPRVPLTGIGLHQHLDIARVYQATLPLENFPNRFVIMKHHLNLKILEMIFNGHRAIEPLVIREIPLAVALIDLLARFADARKRAGGGQDKRGEDKSVQCFHGFKD